MTVLCSTLLFFATIAQTAPSEVRVWHSYRGGEARALEHLAESFNASQTLYAVTLLSVPYDAFANKLTSAIPRGNGPDAFVFAHERIGDWARSGLISPIEGEQAKAVEARMVPTTIGAVRYRDKLWGVPLSFKSLVLYYRTDKIKAPPASTRQLVEIAERLSEPQDGRFGLAFEAASVYFAAPFIFGFGGGFCLEKASDDRTQACLDSPKNAQALTYISSLVREKRIVPEEATAALVTQLFNDGRAPMVINGPWFMGEIDRKVPYEIAVLPTVSETGEVLKPFLTVEAFIVTKQPDTNTAGALAFADHLTSIEGAKVRALVGRQAVATRDAYADPEIARDRKINVLRQQAEIAVPMSNLPAMRLVWEPMAGALRKVLRGAAAPEQALKEAQRQYRVFAKPIPASQNPAVFIAILALAATGGLIWLARSARRLSVSSRIVHKPAPYLYLAPAAIGMVVLVFVPFAVGTCVSFFEHHAGEFRFIGLSNFKSILLSTDFAVTSPMSFYFTLAVTVLWTALNVALHVSIGLALALLLQEPWLRLRGIYRILLIIPWAVPNYITALIWKGMFNRQFGAINAILTMLGVEPVSWFSSFWTSFAANVTTNTWLGFPFMMVTALGALQAIPRELHDAAAVDGASAWQRFRHVTLPLLKPALLPAVILGSVWTFNMFNIIYLVSGGEPDGATEILISESYKWAFERQERYGYAAAYATLIFVVLLVYSKATERLGRRSAA
jgi:arabinogalactan oligomer/maltooligosaccharide transport system permease protein